MSLWVQLGRSGDILNILPLLWREYKAAQGRPERLMVAKDYAGLLEGVSYVDPVIFDGGAQELERAVDEARKLDDKVICTQVNGPLEVVREHVYKPAGQERAVTTSYQKEMWKVAGKLQDWGTHPELPHSQLPLIFDKRSPEREAKLLSVLPKTSKKIVLVAADGISSPFPCKALLFELLKARKYFPVDLGSVKAERLFDLLALYERAFALVAIDSAPLHLANAAPSLPVVALVNDKPILWNGSSWRANHIAYCRYSDFVARAPELLDALDRYHKPESSNVGITHVYNALEETEPMQAPDKHWDFLPIRPGMVGRLDSDGHPYLKDCLKMALQRARHGWVVLSRPGLKLRHDISAQIITNQGQLYAYRLNQEGGRAHFSHVLDLFAAPAKWWRDNMDSIPELHLNRDYFWSQALWALFKADAGRDLTGIVERVSSEPKTSTEKAMPESTKKNADAAGKLYKLFKMTKRFPKISEQAEILPLKGMELEPGGYNPSAILRVDNDILMAYRYHHDGTLATRLAFAQLTYPDLEVVDTFRVNAGEKTSIDDPRLFYGVGGRLWCSFVDGTWPEIPPKCQVRLGLVEGREIRSAITPKIGKNDGTSLEKNWIFWADGQELYCLYETSPEHVVFFGDQRLTCPGPVWPYGVPRGGTVPLEHGDHYLRFFHSSVRNEFISSPHRYFVGAYLMKKEPPFEVVAVSRKPILYGSEMDDYKVKERPHHWKPNVIFPAGAMPVPGGWLLSCGINDAACALIKITPEMLHL